MLRNSLVDWMNWLKHDIGFEGWRFDFVKGYGAEYIAEYCGKTVGNDAWNVGEYWADLRSLTALQRMKADCYHCIRLTWSCYTCLSR